MSCRFPNKARSLKTLRLRHDGKCLTPSMHGRFAAVLFVRCCPDFSSFPAIGHFWVTKTLTFKTRLSAKPFLCIWILFAWEYHWKSSYQKSFKFIMPMVFLLVANLLKHFKRGRRVCMYIACSRPSDSGERCEVKRRAKNKSEGGGEVFPYPSPQSPSTFHRFLYIAPLSTIWTLGTG